MAWAPMALAVAAGVLGAGAAVQAGRAASKQEKYSREAMSVDIKARQVEALQAENERRRQLMLTQASNYAMGAASGFDVFSSGTSFEALRRGNRELAERDIKAIQSGYIYQAGNTAREMGASRARGSSAKRGSYLKATSTLLGAGAQAYKLKP